MRDLPLPKTRDGVILAPRPPAIWGMSAEMSFIRLLMLIGLIASTCTPAGAQAPAPSIADIADHPSQSTAIYRVVGQEIMNQTFTHLLPLVDWIELDLSPLAWSNVQPPDPFMPHPLWGNLGPCRRT